MQTQTAHSDFLLYPQSHKQAKMLALEPSRQQQLPYFQPPYTMDPALTDPFAFQFDTLNGFGQNQAPSRVPQSYYDTPPVYAESASDMKATSFPSTTPPSMATSQPTEHAIPGLSSASGPSIASASSSAIGSPYSGNVQALQENWVDTSHGLGVPAAVVGDLFPGDYMGGAVDPDEFYQKKAQDNYVDPSLIQPMQRQQHLSPPTASYHEQANYSMVPSGFLPQSPIASPLPINEPAAELQSGSPFMRSSSHSRQVSMYDRRSSISSTHSRPSQQSPAGSNFDVDEDGKEKGRCPHPDCGRVFKDLKAHMLTHQSERPEKCPIVTCEYHIKGFARKYDKNRHTLTHYKGTMVCGFCPGSGSPAEKSFNRADVFKRHLTSVHGVEQNPPNCRKRSPTTVNKKATGYGSDVSGKCSTCSATFGNAQDFYEHLDDCVLRVVQQEEPSEAINQQRLAEVASDEEVKKTMEKHMLLDTPETVDRFNDDNDDHDDDDSHELTSLRRSGKGSLKTTKGNSRPVLGNSAVTKPSVNGNGKLRPTTSRRRNNRDRYPQSWGCPSSNMKTKKRVLCIFDGPRRLWKDEMMLDNEFEVRLRLPNGAGDGTNRDAYVTDLDVETLKRVEGVLSANEEERGPWVDGPSNQLMGQPAMLLPDLSHPAEDEVNIDELMS